MVVAPLTSTLMGSIPARFSGLGSAINNSISRVGQPLLGAIIFIAISATFYSALGPLAPGLDTSSRSVRAAFQPLNPPPASATPEQAAAATQARSTPSTSRCCVSAVLLVIGGAVIWFGLRGPRLAAEVGDPRRRRPRGGGPGSAPGRASAADRGTARRGPG